MGVFNEHKTVMILLYGILIGWLIGVIINQVAAGVVYGFFMGWVWWCWPSKNADTKPTPPEDGDGTAQGRSE